jgi:hypothetical protein
MRALRAVLRDPARSSAAATNDTNSGCGRNGVDANSGWNWQPRNHGWSATSTISTSCPSGDAPDSTRPALREPLAILGVELVAVAVALGDVGARVRLERARARLAARTATRRAASSRPSPHVALLGQQVDHRDAASPGSISREFARSSPATWRAILDHRELHADSRSRSTARAARARSAPARILPRRRGCRSRAARGCRRRPRARTRRRASRSRSTRSHARAMREPAW